MRRRSPTPNEKSLKKVYYYIIIISFTMSAVWRFFFVFCDTKTNLIPISAVRHLPQFSWWSHTLLISLSFQSDRRKKSSFSFSWMGKFPTCDWNHCWLEKEAPSEAARFCSILARLKLKKSSRWFYILVQLAGEINLEWFETVSRVQKDKHIKFYFKQEKKKI